MPLTEKSLALPRKAVGGGRCVRGAPSGDDLPCMLSVPLRGCGVGAACLPAQPPGWPRLPFVSPNKALSAPVAPHKAPINSSLARAARATKRPAWRPALIQGWKQLVGAGLIRSVSLHTFTYLDAYSGRRMSMGRGSAHVSRQHRPLQQDRGRTQSAHKAHRWLAGWLPFPDRTGC